MRKLFSILVLTLAISLHVDSSANVTKSICPSTNLSALRCLRNNFDRLYASDYEHFFEVLRAGEKRAIKCDNIKFVTDFFSVVPLINGNAEVSEYFQEAIEKFAVKESDCFLKAVMQLDAKSQKIVANFLKNPVFIEKNKIQNAFSSYRTNPNYRVFVKEVELK